MEVERGHFPLSHSDGTRSSFVCTTFRRRNALGQRFIESTAINSSAYPSLLLSASDAGSEELRLLDTSLFILHLARIPSQRGHKLEPSPGQLPIIRASSKGRCNIPLVIAYMMLF